MAEVVIKYKNPKTLQALKDFAKYFDFVISSEKGEEGKSSIRGVTLVSGDNSIDISELGGIFTNKNIDAEKLRSETWQRRK